MPVVCVAVQTAARLWREDCRISNGIAPQFRLRTLITCSRRENCSGAMHACIQRPECVESLLFSCAVGMLLSSFLDWNVSSV
jgi:hypothetical protein